MNYGRKLTIYMLEGTEFGPRTAEIGNWVGKAVHCTRASINTVLEREEVNNPGVYFLKSIPKSNTFSEGIYIGEAEKIKSRLKSHLNDSKRDFDELIFFISKDHFLTKAHIKYLESRLFDLAANAKSAEILNDNKPSLPALPEAEIMDLEYFLDQMKLVLSVMGFKFLVPAVLRSENDDSITVEARVHYKVKSNNIKATMYQTEQGFVVTKGSQANNKMAPAVNETYKNLRQKLIETQVLVDRGKYLEFADDTIFTSPSSAANIVLGRQTPGPITWLDENNRTLKDRLSEMLSTEL